MYFMSQKAKFSALDWIKNHQDNSNDKLLLIFELQGWLRGTKLEEQPVSLLFLFILFFLMVDFEAKMHLQPAVRHTSFSRCYRGRFFVFVSFLGSACIYSRGVAGLFTTLSLFVAVRFMRYRQKDLLKSMHVVMPFGRVR